MNLIQLLLLLLCNRVVTCEAIANNACHSGHILEVLSAELGAGTCISKSKPATDGLVLQLPHTCALVVEENSVLNRITVASLMEYIF